MERTSCEKWLNQSMAAIRPGQLASTLNVKIPNSAPPVASSLSTPESLTSSIPRRLLSLLTKNNDPIQITCRPCANTGREAHARAFVEAPPLGVVLCTNRLYTREDIEATVTHELVHIYDIEKKKLDLTKCDNLAYSEVRAAREAECA